MSTCVLYNTVNFNTFFIYLLVKTCAKVGYNCDNVFIGVATSLKSKIINASATPVGLLRSHLTYLITEVQQRGVPTTSQKGQGVEAVHDSCPQRPNKNL